MMKFFEKNKKNFFIIWIFLITGLCILNSISYAEVAEITIFENANITSSEISLKQISTIKCQDNNLRGRLDNIIIGDAPLPGGTRTIDESQIILRLKQCDIDLAQISLFAPKSVLVSRQETTIYGNEIERIVLDFIQNKMPWDKSKAKINDIQVCNEVALPVGNVTYKVDMPKHTQFLGKVPVSVTFFVNGDAQKKIWTSVNIEVFTDVVVSKKPLGRYKLITADDIQLAPVDLGKVPANVVTEVTSIIGKRTRRNIEANVIIQEDLIEAPPLVKKGDIVLIIAESAGLKVTALGKVKEKGRVGEMIKVENIDSNRGVYARVIDSKNVMVEF